MKKNITVIGGGTSGYFTTLYFCKNYPDTTVTWIYPEDNKPIGVGETVIPDVVDFLAKLGVSLSAILTDIEGTVKLGVKFEGWAKDNEVFYQPVCSEENPGPIEVTSAEMEYMMANDKMPADFIKQYPDVSIHFDVMLLMKYIDKLLADYSNLRVIRKIVNSIEEVEDDFVVDCTGFSKSFINRKYPDNFENIGHIIPNNAAMVMKFPYTDVDKQRVSYTTCSAKEHGWMFNVPLKNNMAFGYVHDSKYDVKQEYIEHVESRLGRKIDPDKVRLVNIVTGRNKEHILHDNGKTICSIGLSSFFVEPLAATGLWMTIYGIELLEKYLNNEITSAQYNQDYNKEFDAILNFILAHYKNCKRTNEYWDQFKTVEVTPYKDGMIYEKPQWDFLLDGLDSNPKRWKIPAESILKLRKAGTFNDWINNQDNYT